MSQTPDWSSDFTSERFWIQSRGFNDFFLTKILIILQQSNTLFVHQFPGFFKPSKKYNFLNCFYDLLVQCESFSTKPFVHVYKENGVTRGQIYRIVWMRKQFLGKYSHIHINLSNNRVASDRENLVKLGKTYIWQKCS